MDDRILLIPPGFAPDPGSIDELASIRVLSQRLSELMPVDLYRWPWLRGQERCSSDPHEVAVRLEQEIRPEHHVVDLGTGTELLLLALSRRPARSLCVAGFFASVATLKAAGEPELAAAVAAITALSVNPAQIIPVVMQGADEQQSAAAAARVEGTLDKVLFAEVIQRYHCIEFREPAEIRVPALYLHISFPVPGSDRFFPLFRRWVPAARRADLIEWPTRVHLEQGGQELADKVIPFIQGVMDGRELR